MKRKVRQTQSQKKKCKQKKADALLLLIFLCGKFQRIFLFTAKTAHLRASRLNPFYQLSSLIYYNPLAQEKQVVVHVSRGKSAEPSIHLVTLQ